MELKDFLKRLDKRFNKRLIVLLAALSLVLVAGCGGGAGSSSPSTTVPGKSISGQITLNGAGLPGVFVTVQGNGIATTITDTNGNYSVANVDNGVFTVTPSSGLVVPSATTPAYTAYTFSPATSASVTVNGSSVTVPAFTAKTTGTITSASLTGAYNVVSFDNTIPSAVIGTITFTPTANNPTAGTWKGAGTQMVAGKTTAFTSTASSGAFAVSATESSAGLFTITPTTVSDPIGGNVANPMPSPTPAPTANQCIMSADTNTIVCAKVADMFDQKSIIAVKAGTSGYTKASLTGMYYLVGFNVSTGSNSQFGTVTCDGNGGFTYASTQSTAGGANQTVNLSGTYSVTAAGIATFIPTGGTNMTCGLSVDSNTLVCASTGATSVQIGVAVKMAATMSGFTNSSLTGAYYATYLDSMSPFNSGWLIGVFDGNGNSYNVGLQGNSVGPNQPVTGSMPYSVKADGSFTIGATGSQKQCGLSASKNTLVCAEVDKTTEQNVTILIK